MRRASGLARPPASSLNFVANQTLANMITVKLGANGKLRLFNNTGSAHAIFDVAGYYT